MPEIRGEKATTSHHHPKWAAAAACSHRPLAYLPVAALLEYPRLQRNKARREELLIYDPCSSAPSFLLPVDGVGAARGLSGNVVFGWRPGGAERLCSGFRGFAPRCLEALGAREPAVALGKRTPSPPPPTAGSMGRDLGVAMTEGELREELLIYDPCSSAPSFLLPVDGVGAARGLSGNVVFGWRPGGAERLCSGFRGFAPRCLEALGAREPAVALGKRTPSPPPPTAGSMGRDLGVAMTEGELPLGELGEPPPTELSPQKLREHGPAGEQYVGAPSTPQGLPSAPSPREWAPPGSGSSPSPALPSPGAVESLHPYFVFRPQRPELGICWDPLDPPRGSPEAAQTWGPGGTGPGEDRDGEAEEDSDDQRRYRAWTAGRFCSLRAGDPWPGAPENFLFGPVTLQFHRSCAKVRVVVGGEGPERPPSEGPPATGAPERAGHLAALFQPDERTKRRPNTVILQGAVGIGKTVLARKLVLDWARGRPRQDAFRYVFYFNAGDLDGPADRSLAELVAGEWPDPQAPVSEILSRPRRLLFVVDGLEDLKPFLDGPEAELCRAWGEPRPLGRLLQALLRKALLPEARLLVVVRPSGWARLAPWLGCPRLVEVLGLSAADRDDYFYRFFGDPARARAALAVVQDNETLTSLCHAPLVCWVVCTGLKRRLDGGDDLRRGPLTATSLFVSYVAGLFRGRPAPRELQLWGLCRLAAEGVLAHATRFGRGDLERLGLAEADLEPFVASRLLLPRPGGGFTFLHLTLQEFLAALYSAMEVTRWPGLAPSSQDLTTELEKISGENTSFVGTAVHFLFGLLNPECAGPVEEGLGCRLAPQLRRDLLLWAAVVSATPPHSHSLHQFFLSLYEAQDAAFLTQVMDHFQDLRLGLRGKADLLVSSFCLRHCRRLKKLVLHLDRDVFSEDDSELQAGPQASDLATASLWKALCSVLSTSTSLRELDLRFFSLNDLCMKSLSDQLRHRDCRLQNLRVKQTAFVPFACGDFPLALTGHQHLTWLDLNLQLGDDGMKLLCEALRHPQCNLQYLRLRSCALTEACCPDLALALTCNQSLSHLDMGGNQLLDRGVQVLCEALSQPKCRLQSLLLPACGLTAGVCQDLSAALTSNRSLTRLCLASNSLRDDGLKVLSTALKNPECPLQRLALWSCELTAEGCQALSAALHSNKNLTHLDLGENDLRDDGMKLLCEALRQPQCPLQALDMLVCFLTEACCQDLSDALILNQSLRSLNLGHNALRDEGVKLLCKALRHPNCPLQRIGLERCQLNTACCQDLSSVLLCNPRLKSLNLAQNALWDEGVRILCEALEKPECSLQILSLWKEAFSSSAQQMLKATEERKPHLIITGDWYSQDPEDYSSSWWLET
ncbi:NACHT, LRR and PYD domains-containing protein 14-like [Gracilinanus agilis]|uniref:NACHT, LRR and PYD domains-containing protein 14-like n=1 Tax=Gracilinanus agilis TaxID=191870 RepID=UPI001CFD4385|nr:NACHT, LRR and PYD domains-containing protein 14-like [Gracilinanus agilis]